MSIHNESSDAKQQSIKALQSAIGKSEKALTQMTEKGANTTVIAGRLKALRVALALLENAWYQKPHPYTGEEMAEARRALTDLFPSLEAIYVRSKPGSPQRTLLERRMKALTLAVQTIDEFSSR